MEPHSPIDIARADAELSFNQFARFNDDHVGVFRANSPGAGPWEMHPDTDELLHVLGGSVSIETYRPDGNEVMTLSEGQLVVVPSGIWHRHVDAADLVELFYTPGRSLHSEDPATET